jgi:hypothetical protein
MFRRRPWAVAGALILLIVMGLVMRNQVKVYQNRLARARALEARSLHDTLRRSLLTELQPVALKKCTLERFGEANDGGYLMCANLLGGVEAGYSYGISGYDQWGCDISTKLNVPLHQYDCFDTTAPACPAGKTIFHAECVAESTSTVEQRLFDSIENQLAKNGDRGKHVVVKMDVEGAEWESLLSTSDEVLQRIDQLAIEFHWMQNAQGEWPFDSRYSALLQRLKKHFHVAHLHFNNHSCTEGLEPFPAWAYEVLFVSKRLDVEDPSRRAAGLHRFDAPNNALAPDCQPSR